MIQFIKQKYKNPGGAGDGGMVTTPDPDKADKLSIYRSHGSRPKYHHQWIGGNFRLDVLQAAVLRVKLKHLDSWTAQRRQNAALYNRLFAQSPLTTAFSHEVDFSSPDRPQIILPSAPQTRHIYNQYVIRVPIPGRDRLRAYLADNGISTEIYYPVPLHRQPCFAYLGYPPGSLPESEAAAESTLALPVYPELDKDQIARVVDEIVIFLHRLNNA